MIDTEELKDRHLYVNILRAQISEPELSLIFYDAWYFDRVYRRPKFKKLLTKYAVLEDIKEDMLLNPDHINLYPPEAYGQTPPPNEPEQP